MIFSVATFAILVTISLALARAFMGPTLYDRILAVNMVGTKTVLLIGSHLMRKHRRKDQQ